MEDLRELYQEVILEHNKNPRNFRKLDNPSFTLEGLNPLCGDHYTLYVIFENDVVQNISFEGAGCAISKASASLMSELLTGKTRDEAEKIFLLFQHVVKGELNAAEHMDELGKLAVFAGVAEFPTRVKCATLAWHTMHSILNDSKKSAPAV